MTDALPNDPAPNGPTAAKQPSLAFRDIPVPDWADTIYEPIGPGAPRDPDVWIRTIFSVRAIPKPVLALLALRQLLAVLIGVDREHGDVFAASVVEHGEALIAIDRSHLDFRCGIRVEGDLLAVTTTVRLNNLAGRLYFLPVRFLHDPITRAMMRRAIARVR